MRGFLTIGALTAGNERAACIQAWLSDVYFTAQRHVSSRQIVGNYTHPAFGFK